MFQAQPHRKETKNLRICKKGCNYLRTSQTLKFSKEWTMKRLLVILALALPLAVSARGVTRDSNSAAPAAIGAVGQAASALVSGIVGQATSDMQSDVNATPADSSAPAAQNAKSQGTGSGRRQSSGPQAPRADVGYLDDAIIGNEVRVRFDAGFHDFSPDLAEFFYAKCGCYKALPPGLPIFDPNAPGPGPGVPRSVNFQQLYLRAEYAPKRYFSFFVEVPFRWIQPTSFLAAPPFAPWTSHGGLSDIQAGGKFALVAAKKSFLTFQLTAFFPSGNAGNGLGTNHFSVQPEVTYHGIMTHRASIDGQFGVWIPIGGSAGVPTAGSASFAGNILIYGVGASYKVYDTEKVQVSPVLEMVGWHVLGGFQTFPPAPLAALPVGGTNIVNLKAGFRFNFGRNSVYVGYGHAVTHATWYQDIFRMEYRMAF
jgi:hypothetical protein